MTRQSGSMDHYSLEQFTRRLLPGLQPCVAGKVWTAIVPDEPYRAKGLCREGNFPLTPCTFATAPPHHAHPQRDLFYRLLPPSSQKHLTCLATASQAQLLLTAVRCFCSTMQVQWDIIQINSLDSVNYTIKLQFYFNTIQ